MALALSIPWRLAVGVAHIVMGPRSRIRMPAEELAPRTISTQSRQPCILLRIRASRPSTRSAFQVISDQNDVSGGDSCAGDTAVSLAACSNLRSRQPGHEKRVEGGAQVWRRTCHDQRR